jgi:hypothetical protein
MSILNGKRQQIYGKNIIEKKKLDGRNWIGNGYKMIY